MRSISTESRLGVIGDLHGDTHAAIELLRAFRSIDVRVIIQLGDFGFLNNRLEESNLEWVDGVLYEHGQQLLFVDGNHDNHGELNRYVVAEDGIRWITRQVGHLRRGFRTRLASGATIAALGGARSLDPLRGTWDEESITELDLDALGTQPADILIGHDAPLPLPQIDEYLRATAYRWPQAEREYVESGRRMFTRGFKQVRPKLYFGSPFARYVDEVCWYGTPDADQFQTRVVLLDACGVAGAVSQAVLDVATMQVELLDLADLSPCRAYYPSSEDR